MSPDSPAPAPAAGLPQGAAPTVTLAVFGYPIKLSRFTYLLLLGLLVGLVTGFAAVLFRLASHYGQVLLFPHHGTASGWDLFTLAGLKRLLMPAAGGLICGLILFKIGRFTGSHSIPAILQAIATNQIMLRPRMLVAPFLSIVTMATGGSGGGEGPIAEIGSVTGSNIGRWLKTPPRMIKTLLGAGVAAGISAVFNAPIAGLFFAVEVILRNYQIASFTPIAVASVAASVIAQTLLGTHNVIEFPPIGTVPFRTLPLFAVLGLICGAISVAYIRSISFSHHRFHALGLERWMKPMIGGLGVGVIGWVFPQVMGEGYIWVRSVIAGEMAITLLLCLVVFKLVATSLTVGSGSPAGTFAPAVFIGAMAGAAFGKLAMHASLVESTAPFAAMGIAGLVAGALGAPITAIMMILRFSGPESPAVLLPVLTTVAFCVFVMQGRRNISVYTYDMLRSGIDVDRAIAADPLSLIRVRGFTHDSGFEELTPTLEVHAALDRVKDSPARWFVVREAPPAEPAPGADGAESTASRSRDPRGRFIGIVSLHEMRLAIADEQLAHLLTVADITDGFQPRLHLEQSLKEALESFRASDSEVLPVFADPNPGAPFVGIISRQDALNAYTDSTQAEA